MKSKEWAIIIAIVLVVAVAVSLITANITGNVVIRQGFGRQTNVVSPSELNTLITPLMDRSEVSAHLRTTTPTLIADTSLAGTTTRSSFTCDEICNNRKDAAKVCIGGFVQQGNDKDVTYLARPITRCDEPIKIFARTSGTITGQTPLCLCVIQ